MFNDINHSFQKLIAYCENEDFKGFDPYDGLNSKVFQSTPLKNWPLARLAWIQFFKKSPVNFRRLFLVPKDYNAKGIALFLSGYCNIYKAQQIDGSDDPVIQDDLLKKIRYLAAILIWTIQLDGYSGKSWGYNFDWESRAFFLPKYTPTIVVSSFVGNALLDAYEIVSDEEYLKAARSSCNFILKDLNRAYDDAGNFIFSYSKFDNSSVFNASLLGSRLLARVSSITGETNLMEEAKKSMEYVCNFQNINGSWFYGKLPFHQWTDNFHTGFNLECISDYMKFSGDKSYMGNLQKGFDYYVNTFFTPEGVAKYYNTSLYPVDVHSPAQLVITVCKLGRFTDNKELVNKVLGWTIENMQSDQGFFYYQIRKLYKIRIPYMRWSQAWMFYAMSAYILENKRIK